MMISWEQKTNDIRITTKFNLDKDNIVSIDIVERHDFKFKKSFNEVIIEFISEIEITYVTEIEIEGEIKKGEKKDYVDKLTLIDKSNLEQTKNIKSILDL